MCFYSPRSTRSSTEMIHHPLSLKLRYVLEILRFALDDNKGEKENSVGLGVLSGEKKICVEINQPGRQLKIFNESYFSKRRAAETQRFIDRESGAHSSLPHVSATSKKEKTLCLCVSALNKNNINYGKRNEQERNLAKNPANRHYHLDGHCNYPRHNLVHRPDELKKAWSDGQLVSLFSHDSFTLHHNHPKTRKGSLVRSLS